MSFPEILRFFIRKCQVRHRFLCIMSSPGEIFEKKYGVLTNQLEEMRDLMLTYHVQEVGMESTSVYWVPIWHILFASCQIIFPPVPQAWQFSLYASLPIPYGYRCLLTLSVPMGRRRFPLGRLRHKWGLACLFRHTLLT